MTDEKHTNPPTSDLVHCPTCGSLKSPGCYPGGKPPEPATPSPKREPSDHERATAFVQEHAPELMDASRSSIKFRARLEAEFAKVRAEERERMGHSTREPTSEPLPSTVDRRRAHDWWYGSVGPGSGRSAEDQIENLAKLLAEVRADSREALDDTRWARPSLTGPPETTEGSAHEPRKVGRGSGNQADRSHRVSSSEQSTSDAKDDIQRLRIAVTAAKLFARYVTIYGSMVEGHKAEFDQMVRAIEATESEGDSRIVAVKDG